VTPSGRWWAGAGLAVAAAALSPPFEAWVDTTLPAHMAQHVLLTMVAAPLLAVGAATIAAGKVHPLVAWLIFAATGWAIHFSPFFDAAASHLPVHVAEHALLVGTAVLFWAQVVDPTARLSHPMRLAYLGVAMPQNTFLALAIFSAGHVLYPHYAGASNALGRQRLAGGIMWVAGDVALLVAVLLVAAGWARQEERQDSLTEAADLPPSPRTGG